MNIPKFFLLALSIFIFTSSQAQMVKTKDGVAMGQRKIIIMSCIKGAKKEMMNFNGLEFETKKYCECMCDNLIPQVNSWEFKKAAEENRMEEFFLEDKNFDILMQCVKDNVKVEDDFEFGSSKNQEMQKKIGIKSCVNEIMQSEENLDIWTKEMANEYCECAINKLYTAGYTYKDIANVDDENSASFNEIVLPCVQKVLKITDEDLELDEPETPIEAEIIGNQSQSIVPLVEDLSGVYKIKISIEGVTKYFIFDTGATDLIINRDMERELLLEGILKKENYLAKTEYTLANNQTIMAQEVMVDNITLGDYTLNNVVIAIIDEGSLLCGKSFLDKFKKWEINKEKKELILYK